GSFAIAYSLSSGSVTHIERSFAGSGSFLGSASVVRDYFGIFRYDTGIPHFALFGVGDPGQWGAGIASLLFVVGFVWLCRAKPVYAAVIFGPVVVALVASAVQKYPLVARTVLFAGPAAVIGIAAGAAVVVRVARRPPTAAAAVVATGIV